MYMHIKYGANYLRKRERGGFDVVDTYVYTSVMKQSAEINGQAVVSLPCACASLRRAARIVTQRYDHELRRSGMRATQFTLLQALARAKDISQGNLGDILGLDSTTLTRTLSLLRRKGWIRARKGEDRRQLRLSLTAKGAREYGRAWPYWRSAQEKLRKNLGEIDWTRLMNSTIRAAALAQDR
jgi:DNA-binding MarR family transcriptional regulator